MESRKHVSQMSENELTTITKLLHKNGKPFSLTPYSTKRTNERAIRYSYTDILRVIQNGRIVEFHYINSENQRVLIRGKIPYNFKYDLCVVVDVLSRDIVTVYINSANDKHFTINMSIYDESLDVINCLEERLSVCK